MKRFLIFGVWLSAAAALGACVGDDEASDDLGRPCTYDGNCGGELVCDFHMGLGTCQEEHSHGSSSSGTSSSSTG